MANGKKQGSTRNVFILRKKICISLCYFTLGPVLPSLFSVQFSSIQFSSIQFISVQFSSDQFSSALDNTFTLTYHYSFQFNSVQFSSIQFSSIQFSSVQFNSVQFSSVQFSCFMPKRTGPYFCLGEVNWSGHFSSFKRIRHIYIYIYIYFVSKYSSHFLFFHGNLCKQNLRDIIKIFHLFE